MGIYLVAPDGILCHVGHKDQHHIRIHGPDGFGCSKTVQPWHLHVHKNDVESRRIVLCDLGTVCDETDLHLQALLLRILPDEPVQAFPCFFLILYDRNFEHPAPTFSLRLIAVSLFLLKHTFRRNAMENLAGKTDAVPILYHPPQIKKSPDNRLRTFAAVHCPRLMCSAGTTNAKERCNGGSGLSIGVSLFQTIVFSCHSFHKREFDTLYLSRILLKPFCKA